MGTLWQIIIHSIYFDQRQQQYKSDKHLLLPKNFAQKVDILGSPSETSPIVPRARFQNSQTQQRIVITPAPTSERSSSHIRGASSTIFSSTLYLLILNRLLLIAHQSLKYSSLYVLNHSILLPLKHPVRNLIKYKNLELTNHHFMRYNFPQS